MKRRHALAAAASLLLSAFGAMLPPKVDAISPPGGQRGTEVELTLRGQRLLAPQALLLSRTGLEVLSVAAGKDATSCTVKLRLADDCPLGAHPMRLRTAAGLSNFCQFFVGTLREVPEARQGSDAQAVEVPCTIDGSIRAEEIDRYTIALAAGAHCIAEVEAMRLGRGPIDLALSVRGPDGRELVRVDDTAFGHKDPWLAFTAGEAGAYEVGVEAAFADAGNAGTYRLHLGDVPRPTAALPCGGAPGSTFAVSLLGDSLAQVGEVHVPDDGDEWFAFFPSDARGTAPTPIWLRAGGPPEVAPAAAEAGITLPGSASGVVNSPDGVRYQFQAKKGEVTELRALTLGLHSPLDPVLSVENVDSGVLAKDDDTGGAAGDSFVRFTAPADGEYFARVRDLLAHGSATHVFRLEGGPRPRAVRSRLVVARGQEPVLTVPQGGCGGMVLQLDDADVDAGIAFVANALPAGVTATFGRIQKGGNLVPFVLTATADAPLAGALAELALQAEKEPHLRSAGYAQVLPLVMVRNDQPLLQTTQRRLPVAVATAVPFTLAVVSPKVPMVRGAPLGVQVRVQRREGFVGEVRLKALWTPPGIGAGEVTVPADQELGTLPLDANGNAPLGGFPLAVLGTCTVKDEGFEQCSAFGEVTVEKPWLTAKVDGARTTVGTPVELAVEMKWEHAMQGPLQVQLLSLPRGTSAAPVAVAADALATKFAVEIAADAATGRFRDLVLEVRVPHEGAEVVHRFPAGELRIDAPRKAAMPKEAAK